MTARLSFLLGGLLLLLSFWGIWTADGEAKETTVQESGDLTTVLLVGVDEAGSNTDMLMLCTFDRREGSVKLIQIPRDTYYRTEQSEGKINRIYRSVASKKGEKYAAEALVQAVEEAVGQRINGYLLFGVQEVERVVDLIGGVTLTLPTDLVYFDSAEGKERCIAAGRHTLSGKEALAFVRHRKGYTEGDLGRLDAQMRFWAGLFDELPSLANIDGFLAIYKEILPNLLTNLKDKDIIDIIMAYFKNRRSISVEMMRLPGEACLCDGVWYYVLYRAATEKALAYAFGRESVIFDLSERFTASTRSTIKNIADYPDGDFRVYSAKDAKEKRILQN